MRNELRHASVVLRELKKAAKAVNFASIRASTVGSEKQSRSIRKDGTKALCLIFAMMDKVTDVFPDLMDDDLRPSLAPVDLSQHISQLDSEDELRRANSRIALCSHLPSSILVALSKIDGDASAMRRLLETWWESQDMPYLPVNKIVRGLASSKRGWRYHCAKQIKEHFRVDFWDSQTDDVNSKNVVEWIRMSGIDIEYPPADLD